MKIMAQTPPLFEPRGLWRLGRRGRSGIWVAATLALSAFIAPPSSAQITPLGDQITTGVSDCRVQETLAVPMITWAGDFVSFYANGAQSATQVGSLFEALGLSADLYIQDDFQAQLADYLACRSPFLRGTQGMINLAADVTEADPRTEMIGIYKLTFSKGDHLVVRAGISELADLQDQKIAIMSYGPHVDFLGRLLGDAGITLNSVDLIWMDALSGPGSPAEAFAQDDTIAAAFVVTPDMLVLTSDGAVGTGAEGSVKGATSLVSTRTASRIISDVYMVRRDYFEANRAQIEAFTRGLFIAEEEFRAEMTGLARALDSGSSLGVEQTMLLAAISDEFNLNGPEDAGWFWLDAEPSGYRGNVAWAEEASPRSFLAMNNEIQPILLELGLIAQTHGIALADWNYASFAQDLTDTAGVVVPQFDEQEVARVVQQRAVQGTLGDGALFEFEINFKPNQNTFPVELYSDDFARVIDLASVYGGAVITIEGHSDPYQYLKFKSEDASRLQLRRLAQSAKTLSTSRALNVRDAVIRFADEKNVPLDPSQFAVIGLGYTQPKTGNCENNEPCPVRTEADFLSNLRVVFRLVNMEAESAVFVPLD